LPGDRQRPEAGHNRTTTRPPRPSVRSFCAITKECGVTLDPTFEDGDFAGTRGMAQCRYTTVVAYLGQEREQSYTHLVTRGEGAPTHGQKRFDSKPHPDGCSDTTVMNAGVCTRFMSGPMLIRLAGRSHRRLRDVRGVTKPGLTALLKLGSAAPCCQAIISSQMRRSAASTAPSSAPSPHPRCRRCSQHRECSSSRTASSA